MACTIYPSCAQRRRTPPLWERGARRARSSLGRPGRQTPPTRMARGTAHEERHRPGSKPRAMARIHGEKKGNTGRAAEGLCGGASWKRSIRRRTSILAARRRLKPALLRRINRRLQSRDGGDRLLCRRRRIEYFGYVKAT